MINISYHDLLLTILTLFSALVMVYLIVVLNKVSRLCDFLGDSAKRLEPQLVRTLESAEEALEDSRAIFKNGRRATNDLVSVTTMVKAVAEDTTARIEMILSPIRFISSVLVKGQEVFEKFMEKRRQPDEITKEVEDGQE